MPDTTVIYDYVQTRAMWKVVALLNDKQERIPTPKALYFMQLSAMQTAMEAEHGPVVLQRRDPCQEGEHDVRACRLGFWSIDGAIAYVLCGCTRQRQLPRAAWLAAHSEDA